LNGAWAQPHPISVSWPRSIRATRPMLRIRPPP